MALIKQIDKKSPFYKKVNIGDELILINNHKIHDVLDYMFYSPEAGEKISITVDRGGKIVTFSSYLPDGKLYFEFENYLMDRQKSCMNKCMFCFVDQMPANMRDTLYFKDDDYRLSLLYGNYVTMTNVSDEELERIIKMRISPINISVHTTNPELRKKMMSNKNAVKIMEILDRLHTAGINFRAQIVLCPQINDGEELDRTLNDLMNFYPSLTSVSIVPVGLTKYRSGLDELQPFDKKSSQNAIEQINRWGDISLKKFGTRLFYPADEFFIKSEISFPDYGYYEDFEQIENGVGMVVSFESEFNEALYDTAESSKNIDISVVTGKASSGLIKSCTEKLKIKYNNANIKVYTVLNEYFGEMITVTGLITGADIIKQLKDKRLGNYLMIPGVMLREDKFLDDISISDVERELNIKIKISPSTGGGFLKALTE